MSLFNEIFAISAARAQVAATGAVQQVASGTADEFGKLVSNFFAQIPLWFAAIIVAILSYALAVMARRSIEGKLAQQGIAEEHKEVQIVASRSAYILVLVIGFTIALSIVGIDLKPIVAAGAFGLGFALQDVIMNLISGMFILASRHYTIGDVISVNGTTGRIEEIQTRATIIKAFDGTKVIIPNSALFKNKVISKTSNPTRRLEFIMGCGYDDDLRKVMEITLATLKNIPGIIPKPAPKVIFYEWGDFEVLFKIKVWIDSKGGKMLQVKNDVIMMLTEAYNEANFEMPYPIQTVELTSMYSPPAQVDVRVNRKRRAYLGGYPSKFHTTQPAVAPEAQTVSTSGIRNEAQPALPAAELNDTQNSGLSAASSNEEIPTQPALPTAIATTPNSPGQSWLQEALARQTAAQYSDAPTAPAPETAPPETPPTASNEIASSAPAAPVSVPVSAPPASSAPASAASTPETPPIPLAPPPIAPGEPAAPSQPS